MVSVQPFFNNAITFPTLPELKQGDRNSQHKSDWKTNHDDGMRQEMIKSIISFLKASKPCAPNAVLQRLPALATRLEMSLYHNAESSKEYSDLSTLKDRLANIHGNRTKNNGSQVLQLLIHCCSSDLQNEKIFVSKSSLKKIALALPTDVEKLRNLKVLSEEQFIHFGEAIVQVIVSFVNDRHHSFLRIMDKRQRIQKPLHTSTSSDPSFSSLDNRLKYYPTCPSRNSDSSTSISTIHEMSSIFPSNYESSRFNSLDKNSILDRNSSQYRNNSNQDRTSIKRSSSSQDVSRGIRHVSSLLCNEDEVDKVSLQQESSCSTSSRRNNRMEIHSILSETD